MYEQYFYKNPFSGEVYPQSIYHSTPSAQLKSIGNPTIKRIDGPQKATGKGLFCDDINIPGVLYLKFKLSPVSHAKVTSIDTTKAKALPGVVMVLTKADVPTLIDSAPYGFVLQDEVFFDGTEVAAVLAEEEDIAEEAVSLINVTYQTKPLVLFRDDAIKSGATVIHGDTNVQGTAYSAKRGDVDKGFAAAEIIVGPYTYGQTKPTWTEDRDTADFEGDAYTTWWDGQRLTCWSWEKNRYGHHRTAAAAMGLDYNQVHVPPTNVAAVYGGSRGGNNKGLLLTSYLAMKTGRPVKCRYDSFQQIAAKGNQKGPWLTMKAGVKKDGTMTAFSIDNFFDSGGFGGGQEASGHETARGMFNTPNMLCTGTTVTCNTTPNGSIRCVAHPRPTILIGMFVDRVAETTGMDPADFLLKNVNTGFGPGGDLDNANNDACSNAMPAMLQKLITDSGWKSKWKGWKTPMSVNGAKSRGIGIGVHRCTHGSLSNPESASINVNTDGTFTLNCGSYDTGSGARTALAIMAAEELGVPASTVMTAPFDTGSVAESRGPSGSTITRGSGTAIILAARDTKLGLFNAVIAGGLVAGATKPEDLEIQDGNIYLKSNPTVKVTVASVASREQALVGPIIGRGYYATKGNRLTAQWSAAVAEVEVDTDTGEVQVLNITHYTDSGRTIFYQGAVNQAQGAIEMSYR